MSEEISEEEYSKYVEPLQRRMIPKPEIRFDPSEADVVRYQEVGLKYLLRYVENVGLGSYRNNRLFHCGPAALDGLVLGLDLADYGVEVDNFLAVSYNSYGVIRASTSAGDEIDIDPVVGTVDIYQGEPDGESIIELELETPTKIKVDLDFIDSDQYDLDFHDQAIANLGSIKLGQCYGFPTTLEDDLDMKIENTKIVSIVEHILDLHKRKLLEFSFVPYDEFSE